MQAFGLSAELTTGNTITNKEPLEPASSHSEPDTHHAGSSEAGENPAESAAAAQTAAQMQPVKSEAHQLPVSDTERSLADEGTVPLASTARNGDHKTEGVQQKQEL